MRYPPSKSNLNVAQPSLPPKVIDMILLQFIFLNYLPPIFIGQTIQSLAISSGARDVVTLFDSEHSLGHPMFPHAKNIRREIQAMGKRCGPKDVFVFFYLDIDI